MEIFNFEVGAEVGIFDREVEQPAYQEVMRRVAGGNSAMYWLGNRIIYWMIMMNLKEILPELTEPQVTFVNVAEAEHLLA